MKKKARKFFPTAMRREIVKRLGDGEMIRALAQAYATSAYHIRKIRNAAGIPVMRCRNLPLSVRQKIEQDPRSAQSVAQEFRVNPKTVAKLQRAYRARVGQPDLKEFAIQMVQNVLAKSFGGEFPSPVEGDPAFTAALLATFRSLVPSFEHQSQPVLDCFATHISQAVSALRFQQQRHLVH